MVALGAKTKSAAIADLLRSRIHAGQLRPGTQLLQDDLASEFGTSATPVREAFGVLEAEGLVQRRPHRGVIVSLAHEVDDWERELTLDVRGILEMRAIEHIIREPDPEVLGLLRNSVEIGRRALEVERNYLQLRHSISDFHRALAVGLGSEFHTQILNQLSARTQFYPHALSHDHSARALGFHERLLDALVVGDRALAAEIWASHAHDNAQALDAVRGVGLESLDEDD